LRRRLEWLNQMMMGLKREDHIAREQLPLYIDERPVYRDAQGDARRRIKKAKWPRATGG
jgi:hypothetical protein